LKKNSVILIKRIINKLKRFNVSELIVFMSMSLIYLFLIDEELYNSCQMYRQLKIKKLLGVAYSIIYYSGHFCYFLFFFYFFKKKKKKKIKNAVTTSMFLVLFCEVNIRIIVNGFKRFLVIFRFYSLNKNEKKKNYVMKGPFSLLIHYI